MIMRPENRGDPFPCGRCKTTTYVAVEDNGRAWWLCVDCLAQRVHAAEDAVDVLAGLLEQIAANIEDELSLGGRNSAGVSPNEIRALLRGEGTG